MAAFFVDAMMLFYLHHCRSCACPNRGGGAGGAGGCGSYFTYTCPWAFLGEVLCLVLSLLWGATLATFVVGVVYRLLEEELFDDTLCALILLLEQCSNTCQCCCWHTVRTHVCLRAEAILSDFEHFLTSSWQKLAPKTSPMCSNTS